MTNEGLIDGTPTFTFELLMRSIEDKEEEIMSIPNELYQPMNKSKNRNMSDRESYFDRESYYDFTIPPNDLFFNDQWPFHKMNNHADINIEEGWKTYLSATDNSDNGKEVIIAVIDSGIDYTHPDLKEAMWKNPGEISNNVLMMTTMDISMIYMELILLEKIKKVILWILMAMAPTVLESFMPNQMVEVT